MIVAAERDVHAAAAAVFAFLADLRNHWRLGGQWVVLDGLTGPGHGPTGGTVVLRGPLGLRRMVRTSVVDSQPVREMHGQAQIGARTCAAVRWTVDPLGPDLSHVTLKATVLDAAPLDRVVLRIGGLKWLSRRFEETLSHLDRTLARPPALPSPSVAEALA